jgi:hypothetical protein
MQKAYIYIHIYIHIIYMHISTYIYTGPHTHIPSMAGAFARWTTRCKTWEKQSRLKTRPSPSRPGKTWGKHGQIMAIFVESSGEWFVKYGNNMKYG